MPTLLCKNFLDMVSIILFVAFQPVQWHGTSIILKTYYRYIRFLTIQHLISDFYQVISKSKCWTGTN